MTPAAPARAKPRPTPAAPARAKSRPATGTSASPRTAPRRAPRAPGPRRVSGPARTRPSVARQPAQQGRLAAFLRSLPDHPLLDRVVRGRAWIPLLGVMLVGIVAMQVELLKLNASTGRSIELSSVLQTRNESLRAEVASASNPNRIERIATHMGMTMPGPEAITFLSARSASVQRALAGIHPPDVAAFGAALNVASAGASTPTASATTPSAPASKTASPSQTTSPSQTATTSQSANAQTATQTNTSAAPPATVP